MQILIGENIKRLRKTKNITQEQLAEAMNVSCPAVSKWERNESYPDITMLTPLALYFGVSIDELMGYDEAKIQKDIDGLLDEFNDLMNKDQAVATELIRKAREDYPNDYLIMHIYMWYTAGDLANNDPRVLLSHKDEFLDICRRIEEGCKDVHIRLEALNMRAKILYAEGKSDEAIKIYHDNFPNWWETACQKTEQLYPKDTPEFMHWVKRNSYELVTFAGDKLVKSVFFDSPIEYTDRINRIEHYGDLMDKIYGETEEVFFLILARSIYGRLTKDLRFHGGKDEDVQRIEEKLVLSKKKLSEIAKIYPIVDFFSKELYC